MEKRTPLCNGRESNADKVKDSETTLLVSKKGDKNDLVDSEKTPQSYVDVEFELLASTAGTMMTHKYRGSIIVLSIRKSVEPNEEQKEMISGFQQGILCKY